jgi:hypothetical protein
MKLNFSTCYGIQSLIALSTIALKSPLSWSQISKLHTALSYLSNIHFNIIHSPTVGLPGSLFLWAFSQIFYRHSSLAPPCYMTCQPHSPRLHHSYFYLFSRSQWSSGLGHELFSPAPTQRSWVRIPHRHGCLCVFCVRFFCFYSLK